MRNSTISKSNQSSFANPFLHETRLKETKLHQSVSKNQSIIFNEQKSQKNLFKQFQDSTQLIQQNKPSHQIPLKPIQSSQQQNSPLLHQSKKSAIYFEPSSFDHQQNQSKNKLGINSNKFINFQTNPLQQMNRSKQDQILKFGQGLQGIQNNPGSYSQKSFPGKGAGKFVPEKDINSYEQMSSTFSPLPSNISVSKRLPHLISSAQMQLSGRNFFKKSSSMTASKQFFRGTVLSVPKGDKKEGNLNSSISRFKESDSSGMAQKMRSSSQIRSTRNSFNAISHITTQSKTGFKKEASYLSLANNMSLLLFKYSGGHAASLLNNRLKIKNESSVRLSIKIKCISPRSYEVRSPTEKILEPSEILNVTIEMKLFPHDLNHTTMKHDLTRYELDKFKIVYRTLDNTEGNCFEGEKILPVVIEQTEQEKARNIGYEQSISNEKMKQGLETKQTQIYRTLIEKNKEKIKGLDKKISDLNSCEFRHKYISKQFFLFFGLLGTALGFWFG